MARSTNGAVPVKTASKARSRNRTLTESRIARDGLNPGTRAPGVKLPLAGGGELSLDDYRGSRILLVFSDPECGPCMELAPQLERSHRASATPQIVMVSRTAEKTRAKIAELELTFPVLLQRRWEVSRAFAMFSLPNAYLIDEHGIVAAPVAVGSQAIMALASGGEPGMEARVTARLSTLHEEFEKGEAELARIERERTELRETLFRIGGAIQVLTELDSNNQEKD